MYFGTVFWTLAYFRQITGIGCRYMPGHRISLLNLGLFCYTRPPNDLLSEYLTGWDNVKGHHCILSPIPGLLWSILLHFNLLCSNSMDPESAMAFGLGWLLQGHPGLWKVRYDWYFINITLATAPQAQLCCAPCWTVIPSAFVTSLLIFLIDIIGAIWQCCKIHTIFVFRVTFVILV